MPRSFLLHFRRQLHLTPPPLAPPPPLDRSSHIRSLLLSSRSLSDARQSHAQAAVRGLLHHHLPTRAALILAYSDSGDTPSFFRLFDQSPPRHRGDAFLWNTLVRAYNKTGRHGDALGVYNSMARTGVRPDGRTFPFVLKVCADAEAHRKGREVHGSVVKTGFGGDVFVGNTLVAFYGACADVRGAGKVFDEMSDRDVVSWNSLISVLSDNGSVLESLGCFLELTRSSLPINSVSVISTLTVCAELEDEGLGKLVHGRAVKAGLDSQVTVANTFVDLYAKCGNPDASLQVFYGIAEKNDVSWNSIIGGLVHVGKLADAVKMLRDMVAGGTKVNPVTISVLLPALVELGLFDLGREVHGHSMRSAMDGDMFVANTLLDMYAKAGHVKEASEVFGRMERKNVVSWNVMIANFAQNKAEEEAICLVREMQVSGECPNAVTFTNVLPACSRISSLNYGKEIHAKSIRMGSCFDLFVSNALMDMYVKCGCMDLARVVFEMSKRDEVSYNTLIMGYSQSWNCLEALQLFVDMGCKNLKYDSVSFMGVLSACANMSAVKQGKEIHAFLVRKLFHRHLFVANSLLDMYTRSGHVNYAKRVFEEIPNKDVASWNCMMLGYAMQGELDSAFDLFDSMKDESIEYDSVSFITVLSACSHSGLVNRGKRYFQQLLSLKIQPTQMHYACMVDILGRAGLLKEAVELINDMPFEADANVWGALLGACRMYGNLEYGRLAAEHLFLLKPEHSGYYVLLSNMYAEAGRWNEADEIRRRMKTKGVKKNPGYSWVESGNKACAFVVGERIEAGP